MTNLIDRLRSAQHNNEIESHNNNDDLSLPREVQETDIKKITVRLAAVKINTNSSLLSLKEDRQRKLQDLTKTLRATKEELEKVEKQLDSVSNIEKLIPDIEKQLMDIMNKLPIAHIELKETATTVFTTQLIKKGNQLRGVYRIYIDWLADGHSRALRINNIYKRVGTGYDHPCVSGRSICMGNADPTFRKLFAEKSVYELVEAIIIFLISDTVGNGYIHSWSDWLKQARKVNPQREFNSFMGVGPNTNSRIISIENDILARQKSKVPRAYSIDTPNPALAADYIPF